MLLSSCQPVMLGPYKNGEYIIEPVEIVVADTAHATDTAFIERFRVKLAEHLNRRHPDNTNLPHVRMVATLDKFSHSEAEGFELISHIELIDEASGRLLKRYYIHNTIGEPSEGREMGAYQGASMGLGSAIAGAFMGSTLDYMFNPQDIDSKTEALINTHTLSIVIKAQY